MFLTRMELDVSKRSTMKALVSPNLIHGAVEAAFPGTRDRTLWRIDSVGGRCYLLLLSPRQPNLRAAAEQFGVPGAKMQWETKSYDPLLARIEEHTVWRFRLTANPTKSCKAGQGQTKRGIVCAHITPHYQQQWLRQRSEKHGFLLEENSFSVVGSSWQRFYKGSQRARPVTLLSVTYEGILTVTDPQAFCQTLTNGIGRGKAFGMGLLTVVRAGGAPQG